MKNIYCLATVAIALLATPAIAAPKVTSVSAATAANSAPADATTVFNFNQQGTVAYGRSVGYDVTLNGTARYIEGTELLNPSTPNPSLSLTPNPQDGGYFVVAKDSSAVFLGKSALSNVSMFIGSLDAFNQVELLGSTGASLFTFSGNDMSGGTALPNPGDGSAARNRLVSFSALAGDPSFYGIRLSNTGGNSSFELDNLAFTAAVPEPTTWAMMLVGFGMIGAASRHRRRSRNAVIA